MSRGEPPSFFADAMMLAAGEGRFALSFEDLSGFSFDYPAFALPDGLRLHGTPLCRCAKETTGGLACAQHKQRCNRRVMSGGGAAAHVGLCHLGLQERVEPLRAGGRVLGVFYFGAVIPTEKEAASRRRLERTCQRLGFEIEPLLTQWAAMPRATPQEWEEGVKRFEAMVRLVTRLVEDLPLTAEAGPLHESTSHAARARRCSPLTRKLLARVNEDYAQTVTLAQWAGELGCHPGYLSRLFKRETGVEFQRHLHRVRVTRAKELLRARGMNVTRVAYETGFSDASHFCRVFRQLEGCSPGEFLERA